MSMSLRGKGITLEKILSPTDASKRKTKVRCLSLMVVGLAPRTRGAFVAARRLRLRCRWTSTL